MTLHGWRLEHASAHLRRDRVVVLAAVANFGASLEFAPEELRKDREIVLKAVSSNPLALKFAHAHFLEDQEVMNIVWRRLEDEQVHDGGYLYEPGDLEDFRDWLDAADEKKREENIMNNKGNVTVGFRPPGFMTCRLM